MQFYPLKIQTTDGNEMLVHLKLRDNLDVNFVDHGLQSGQFFKVFWKLHCIIPVAADQVSPL